MCVCVCLFLFVSTCIRSVRQCFIALSCILKRSYHAYKPLHLTFSQIPRFSQLFVFFLADKEKKTKQTSQQQPNQIVERRLILVDEYTSVNPLLRVYVAPDMTNEVGYAVDPDL